MVLMGPQFKKNRKKKTNRKKPKRKNMKLEILYWTSDSSKWKTNKYLNIHFIITDFDSAFFFSNTSLVSSRHEPFLFLLYIKSGNIFQHSFSHTS